jgi:hypothetical protein
MGKFDLLIRAFMTGSSGAEHQIRIPISSIFHIYYLVVDKLYWNEFLACQETRNSVIVEISNR